jgi:hypothetical protein
MAHKELAWLSLLKESRHFNNTTVAFAQKRIDPEILLQKKPGRFYPARF